MELQHFDPNQNSGLTPIGKALNSPKVRVANQKDLLTIIAGSIAKAFADSGQSSNGVDMNYLIKETASEIKELYPCMRIEEIPIAMKYGIREEYGQYFGLNIKSFSFFFKSYLESQKRINEAKQLRQNQEPEKPVPSKEEIQQLVKEAIINAYQTYLAKGQYDDHGNFIYNKMDELKLFRLGTDKKQLIFEQAKTSLLMRNNPETAVNRSEFKKMSETINLINDNESGRKTIQTEAKKIALNFIFDQFKKDNVDIKQLINQTDAF